MDEVYIYGMGNVVGLLLMMSLLDQITEIIPADYLYT